jgi:hypothetical protein
MKPICGTFFIFAPNVFEMFFRASVVIILCWVSSDLWAQPGIRSVVIEKTVSNAKRAWDVYSDGGMEHVVGSINPGDSVRVLNWKPWVYRIEGKSIAGYISWRAILVTPALSRMAKELEKKSDSLVSIAAVADSLEKFKYLRYWLPVLDSHALSESGRIVNDVTLSSDQSAFLRLYASDKNIDVGECTTLNLSFYVGNFNRLPIQFHDLANQLSAIKTGPLNHSGSWYADANLSEVKWSSVKVNGVSFTEYRLLSRAYCPDEAKPLDFKEVQLTLMKVDLKTKKEIPMVFASKPLMINVRPAANADATASDFFKLTGKFIVTDSVHTQVSDSPIGYTVTLKGKGYSFPVQPPILIGKNFTSELISTQEIDTIIHDTFYSSKSFTWKLYMKEGEHVLWSKPVFSFYNPETASVRQLELNRIITVPPGQAVDVHPISPAAPDHFILLDVSQSMRIEDYAPNRLGMVKNGLLNFLPSRITCDVGLITFSGKPLRFDISKKDMCYSKDQIKKIGFNELYRGTAIGDAVWAAVHAINPQAAVKKIIIIGDGENTAGYTSILRAIALASKYKVVVHSIGIGEGGDVPFGVDPAGKPILISSNFSDGTLKLIADRTGGKYFHAKSSDDVTRFLQEILAE